MKLKHIPYAVNAREPIDVNGFAANDNGKAKYIPFDDIPLEGDAIPKGYTGWLLDLEELDQADPSMQKALHRLILEREVGKHKIHPKVYFIASGNRPEDKAHASLLSSALQSRMAHITLDSNLVVTTNYGMRMGWDSGILGYINFRVDNLNNFDGRKTIGSYACERSWEMADKLLKVWAKNGEPLSAKVEELSGTIGDAAAVDFVAFMEIKDDLITVADILANPKTIDIPSNVGALFAVTTTLAATISQKEFLYAYSFLTRLPFEYQLLAFRSLLIRFPTLITTPEMNMWTKEHGEQLYNF